MAGDRHAPPAQGRWGVTTKDEMRKILPTLAGGTSSTNDHVLALTLVATDLLDRVERLEGEVADLRRKVMFVGSPIGRPG